jgi:hypothetical protein
LRKGGGAVITGKKSASLLTGSRINDIENHYHIEPPTK